MKPWGWKFHCVTGLALALFAGINPFSSSAATAQISASACSATPCTFTDLFDKELAELRATKNQEVDSTVQAIKDANKNDDRGCYPAAASITIFSQSTDPKLEKLIAAARSEALTTYMTDKNGNGTDKKGPGLVEGTDFDISTILGQGDKTQVQFNGIDRDPPIIRTNSNPPKGTKVKEGQKIAVHSTVRDSNKSWPTGVKSIQLIANGLLEEPAEDYGMKPPPCQVRTFERTYTVPANPPPVVKLRVYAEDAVGHGTFEEADFPTRGDYFGTLSFESQQRVPSGTQYFTGRFDITLTRDKNGNLTGALSGSQSQKLALSSCPSDTIKPASVSLKLTGVIKDPDAISLDASDGTSTGIQMSPCPGSGSPGTTPPVYTWPHFAQIFHDLRANKDGIYLFDNKWTNTGPGPYPYTEHYVLKLQPAKP